MPAEPIQTYPHLLKNWRKARKLGQDFMAELFQCERRTVARWESSGMIQPRYFMTWHYQTEELDHLSVQIPGYSENLPWSDDPEEMRAINQLHAWLTAPGEMVRQNYCPPLFLLPPFVITNLVRRGITESRYGELK